ncbi:hypothetical protein ANO11243_085110 [Dothideomycetidae sp. 11243]|nr:hypothetical protein ANO11243_085110 [fungal sp. No.11243]
MHQAYHISPSPSGRLLLHTRSGRRLTLPATILILLLLFVISIYTFNALETTPPATTYQSTIYEDSATPPRAANAEPKAVRLGGVKSKYAFATLLAGDGKEVPYEQDKYLISTRILAYQLLHANETRSRDRNIPFIVLVTDQTSQSARERLRRDGATVLEVPAITADWLAPRRERWKKVMTKLRLWELVDFERIAFLDADSLLAQPLDHIFHDPAAAEQMTNQQAFRGPGDPSTMPASYVFGGNHDNLHIPRPGQKPLKMKGDLCAGFFILKPDVALLRHYLSALHQPHSFKSDLPEQNLLTAVHGWNGSMPWKQIDLKTNAFSPGIYDIQKGIKTIHEKWWFEGCDAELQRWMMNRRWMMEGFFEARDQMGS